MSFTRRAAIAATLCLFISPALAHGYTIGDLEIGHPWSRATPPAARVAGGYLKITNRGAAPDRLIAASFSGSNTVELHEMSNENGVMRMRELRDGITIAPGETVELKPGGLHLMFMGLKSGLVEKQRLKGELVFEKAGRIEVEFAVDAIGAKGGETDHGAHGAKTQ